MPTDPPVDPSEIHSEPAGHDPRSAYWRHATSPGGGFAYPDVLDDAKRFRTDRGYWPPGHPLRHREDEEADRRGDPHDAHPGARGDGFTTTLALAIRQELIGARIGIGPDSLLATALRIEPGAAARRYGEEAAYAIRTYVLREDLPPVTADVERTVHVTISQVSPVTWWDHFKLTYGHRWWLHWLTTRRPARIVERPQSRWVKVKATFDLDRHRLYPRASRAVVRTLGEPVMVAVPRPVRFADWIGGPGVDV